MKKGLRCEATYDAAGNWMLVVEKDRGKLTLEDIREAATEYEEDYYALVLKCISSEGTQWYDDDIQGDVAELYRLADVLKVIGRVKKLQQS